MISLQAELQGGAEAMEEVVPATPRSDAAAAVAAARLPPPFQGRAREGARRLLAAMLPSVLPPVIKEIREWTAALRGTASRSLHSMVALAEGAVLPHLPALLPALTTAVADEEAVVALRIIGVAHVIGAFCEVRRLFVLVHLLCWGGRGYSL